MKKAVSLKEDIGKRIDFIRKEMHLPKEQFAKLIGVTGQHLGKVISGEAGLSVEKIIELSLKTGYTADFILLGNKTEIDVAIKEKLKLEMAKIEVACNSILNISKIL